MRVGFFVTCLVDVMRPEIGMAALTLLQKAGCEVVVPRAQTCCGQPALSSGNKKAARALALKFLQEFEGFDYVVVPSGSCCGTIRKYYSELLSDDPPLLSRVECLASRVYELTDFLHAVLKVDRLHNGKDRFEGVVTYHDSCTGLRELGIQQQPRALLANKPGIELKEMKGSHHCCGFGGIFSLNYDQISCAITDEKCAAIHASGAQAVVLGDLGCMLQIEGRLRRLGDEKTRVLHIAQILADECKKDD